MKEKYRLFYYFLQGSFGGLTGWFLQALAYRGVDSQDLNVLIFRGAILGSFIGISIAAYEGIASRSFVRFIKFGFIGFSLGAVAGAIALPSTARIYCSLLGDCRITATNRPGAIVAILVGIICWALFGGVIGLLEGIGKGTQIYKGFLGGVIGGIVGGAVYEIARAQGLTSGSSNSQIFVAISLTLLGGFVGGAIALISTLLSEAKILVLDGKLAGRPYDVTRFVDRTSKKRQRGIIGSDKTRAHIFLPGGKGILPQHAYISYVNEAPTISASPEAEKTKSVILLNDRPITRSPLSNGDKIQIGNIHLQYQQTRKKG